METEKLDYLEKFSRSVKLDFGKGSGTRKLSFEKISWVY
jgi:hypothetical protein